MQRILKYYPIHQSPFYKLKSKKKLSTLLGITLNELSKLTEGKYYNTFLTKKKREIQEPRRKLKIVHAKIKKKLCNLEYPDYLFSGIRGRSSVSNAKHHLHSKYILICDIKSFYRSCEKKYILRFFLFTLKTSPDIARIMAEILCYTSMIPTGSPSSQIIAYWAYAFIFDKINEYAQLNNIDFSLYVDDMTFSSKVRIPIKFHLEINKILNTVNLKIKLSKTKYYSDIQSKCITGCILTTKNKLCVKNKQKKKVIDYLKILSRKEINDNKMKEKTKNSIRGMLNYINQIEPELFKHTKTTLFKKNKKGDNNLMVLSDHIYIFTDGGSKGNPGQGSIGVVLCDIRNTVLHEFSKCIGNCTNNQAEYKAILKGLVLCAKYTQKKVIVYSDSQLVINHLNGVYHLKNNNLRVLYRKVKDQERFYESVVYQHINRCGNQRIKRADELVNQAYAGKPIDKSMIK